MSPAGAARFAGVAGIPLAAAVGLGLIGTGAVVVQATALATALADLAAGTAPGGPMLTVLAGTTAVRAAVTWAQEVVAARAAIVTRTAVRTRLLGHVARLGPAWLAGARPTEVTTVATRGLDALDVYIGRYLPQTVLAIATPVVILARLTPADVVATVTVALTLPLIPVFLALVGWTTRDRTEAQLGTLRRLAHHFLDVVAGLPTLRAYGRDRAQIATIASVTDAFRRRTLRTLRLSFLSSLVLDLVATLSVALVAVGVGLRLVSGGLDLRTGLLVLILAPEAYLPLRRLGADYHAAADGAAALSHVDDILAVAPPAAGPVTRIPTGSGVRLEGVTVAFPDRPRPALDHLDLAVAPGETIALTGPSGCGKSTVLRAILGQVTVGAGRVSRGPLDHRDADPVAWRQAVAYVPQTPVLVAGTVADNVRAVCPQATDSAVRVAAGRAGLPPALLTRSIGDDGRGLSAGQRQRVALARAFLSDADLVLLDEPTANLDATTEAGVLPAIADLVAGRTAVIVAHRPSLLPLADRVVDLGRVGASR